ncbi:RimK-like ATP-grasp domain-containing protein [Fodinibius roseus]|uniref:RimK-like ATP-grasp domain-containing protein n=1 Tax=Fodinibius roseus TaxID=1194090 RepID=A0A1M4SQ28_9BACT|nr:hypothetical protein [Fodinibius roseus]SHE34282.1 RimK-like ATP-grasp domain-containing protein [Fodinibius roseus]
MKIAIHHKENDFSSSWIEHCEKKQIDYKIVNCYDNDIIDQVNDCDALMWHFHHAKPEDVLFAKQLIYALQTSGKKVFPNFQTSWHFDDKVGQKYLLEAIGASLVPSYVFYDKQKALQWIGETTFPKVFKLRKGAGSAHVKLVKNKSDARKLVLKAFSRGFSQYDKVANLKDRWYKYKKGKTGLWNLVKGVLRFAKTTEFARTEGREKGYIYFQDFIPDNDHDIRVVVIADRAYTIKRMVRESDFRASGSAIKYMDKELFKEGTIKLAFEITEKLEAQCLAFDFIYDGEEPKIVEISYGFRTHEFPGFWDRDLNWHEGSSNAPGYMVESLTASIQSEIV